MGNDLLSLLKRAVRQKSADLYRTYTPANHRGRPCGVAGCPNVAYAKELCNAHYIRARSGRDMAVPLQQRARNAICANCDRPVDGKGGWGLCKPHYQVTRRSIIRRVCIEVLGDQCSRCGGKFHDRVYDFHHRDPSTKEGAHSDILSNHSLAAVAAEVAKCDLLCANCHRITHGERQF